LLSVQKVRSKRAVFGCLAVALMVATAGCGSDSKGSSSSGDGGGAKVDQASAQKLIDSYIGKPSAFPVTEPLKQLPPKGTRVALLDIGTPVNALFNQLFKPAAKQLGVDVYQVKAGGDAQGINAAFDTIVQQKPDAVVALAIDPILYKPQLDKLRDAGVIVEDAFISNGDKYGFDTVQFGAQDSNLIGQLLASWAIAKGDGKPTEMVFYRVPELAPVVQQAKAAQAETKKLCPDCTLRIVDVPIAEIGNKAPSRIVSDLQAHPKTTNALFGNDELTVALLPALKTAGINIKIIGAGPTPGNLEALKQGREDAAIGIDFNVMSWTLLDQIARELAGQPLAGGEKDGLTVKQILLKEDITFDPAMGWTGYPDVAQRFAKIWGVEPPPAP
jgi:ribose transport system substrate-binding protein